MCVLRGPLWDRLEGYTPYLLIFWSAFAKRRELFYGLNLEKRIYAYYSIVYNLL